MSNALRAPAAHGVSSKLFRGILDYTRRARVARRIYCVGTTQIFLADATILEYVRSFELYPRGEIAGETGMGKCDTRIVFVATRFCKMS